MAAAQKPAARSWRRNRREMRPQGYSEAEFIALYYHPKVIQDFVNFRGTGFQPVIVRMSQAGSLLHVGKSGQWDSIPRRGPWERWYSAGK